MTHLGFNHIDLATHDMAATRAFYEDLIGLPLVATWSEQDELFGAVRAPVGQHLEPARLEQVPLAGLRRQGSGRADGEREHQGGQAKTPHAERLSRRRPTDWPPTPICETRFG